MPWLCACAYAKYPVAFWEWKFPTHVCWCQVDIIVFYSYTFFSIFWTQTLTRVQTCLQQVLTHWGRVTHICVNKLNITGSDICVNKLNITGADNSFSPGRRQAIIWTNDDILLTGPLGTNFSEILSEIHALSFTKIHLKTSSAKWRPFCLDLNVLKMSSKCCYKSLYLNISD